jgi:hypothetical protein
MTNRYTFKLEIVDEGDCKDGSYLDSYETENSNLEDAIESLQDYINSYYPESFVVDVLGEAEVEEDIYQTATDYYKNTTWERD